LVSGTAIKATQSVVGCLWISTKLLGDVLKRGLTSYIAGVAGVGFHCDLSLEKDNRRKTAENKVKRRVAM